MTTIEENVEKHMRWVKEAYPKFVKEFGKKKAAKLVAHDAYQEKIIGEFKVEAVEEFLKEQKEVEDTTDYPRGPLVMP